MKPTSCDLSEHQRLHDRIVAKLKPLPPEWRLDPRTVYGQDGTSQRAVVGSVTMKPRIAKESAKPSTKRTA